MSVNEKELLTSLLAALLAQGYVAVAVDDGGDSGFEARDQTQIVEVALAVSCATIDFRREGDSKLRSLLFIVQGNGVDLVSDWTTGDTDFSLAVEAWLDTLPEGG